MCDTGNPAAILPAEALPASLEWTSEVLPLKPVDELSVLTVCDNTMDLLLPDEGPARRLSLAGMGRQAPVLTAPTLDEGTVPDAPLAQHGFSALVEVRKGSRVRRLLFDTGLTPDGCAENLRCLGQDPAGIEAIVCSHGHFDHTTGLSGLIGRLGRTGLPVLIHPEFWARRRLAIPGGEPFELPTTSRRALDEAGFEVIEQQQPSFLFDRSVLITGEVDRVTGFEKGFPIHQAWRHDHAGAVPAAVRRLILLCGVRAEHDQRSSTRPRSSRPGSGPPATASPRPAGRSARSSALTRSPRCRRSASAGPAPWWPAPRCWACSPRSPAARAQGQSLEEVIEHRFPADAVRPGVAESHGTRLARA